MKTRKWARPVKPVHYAAGLYDSHRRCIHLFKDFVSGATRKELIAIGRSHRCDIRVDDLYASKVQALLEWREDRLGGAMWLHDKSTTNGVYIDDRLVTDPVALAVGMHIEFGRSLLIATQEKGSFPIDATTVSSLCRKATDLYGNYGIAAEHVGRSREFVRRMHIPREQRSARKKKAKSRKKRK